MTKRIAYMRADGGLTISEIIGKEQFPHLSDAEYEAMQDRVLAARMQRKGATNAVALPADWAPPDASRDFRDAWELSDGKINVNMGKAREVHRARLRRAREPLLADLDIAAMRADEDGDRGRKTAVVAEKRALRDVTDDPRIDSAVTPDDLRAAWPETLGPAPYRGRG